MWYGEMDTAARVVLRGCCVRLGASACAELFVCSVIRLMTVSLFTNLQRQGAEPEAVHLLTN